MLIGSNFRNNSGNKALRFGCETTETGTKFCDKMEKAIQILIDANIPRETAEKLVDNAVKDLEELVTSHKTAVDMLSKHIDRHPDRWLKEINDKIANNINNRKA